jgi:hypothetical protein
MLGRMILEINSFVGAVLCVCSFQVAIICPYVKSLQWRFWKALFQPRAFFLTKLIIDTVLETEYNDK